MVENREKDGYREERSQGIKYSCLLQLKNIE